MNNPVVFYQLSCRFLQKGQTFPPDAEQMLSSAVAVVPEGEAWRKLDGLRRFGEITGDSTHTGPSEVPSARLVRISMQRQKSGPVGSIKPRKQLIGSLLSP